MPATFSDAAAHVERDPLPGFHRRHAATATVRAAVHEDGHGELPLRSERFVVRDILWRGAIKIEARAHRARLTIGAQVFSLRLLGYRVGPCTKRAVEEPEVHVFAAGSKRF